MEESKPFNKEEFEEGARQFEKGTNFYDEDPNLSDEEIEKETGAWQRGYKYARMYATLW